MYKFLLIAFLAMAPMTAQDFEEPDYIVDWDPEAIFQVDSTSLEMREFPIDFREKYSGEDFIYQHKSVEKNLWDRFLDSLANWLRSIFDIGTQESSLDIAVNVVRVIAVLIILLVIYLIAKAVLNKEGRWIFGGSNKVIRYEDVETNIHTTDFEKLISDTLRLGEKRLSVRYYYLYLLKKMSERGIIHWDIEKTNSDYLYEIQDPERKTDFAYLSYLYNYIWYGEFELDQAMFDKAKTAFDKSINSLR